MAWEYLDTEKWDERFIPIANYLKDKTKNKVIIDLNCGSARLHKYLDDDFKAYIGNDTRDLDCREDIDFKCQTDGEFVKEVTQCDILLYIGAGGGYFTKNEDESEYGYLAFLDLVRRFRPRYIAVESIIAWQEHYGFFTRLEKELPWYTLVREESITVEDSFIGKRHYQIYELTKQVFATHKWRQGITEEYIWFSQYCVNISKALPTVLKTDVYNEIMGFPPGGVFPRLKCTGEKYTIDIEKYYIDVFNEADFSDIHAEVGDVRFLKKDWYGKFDLVLDLSTLDHIHPEEIESAISEYNRVLKPGGVLGLIFWAAEAVDYIPHEIQYFFPPKFALSILKRYFIEYDNAKFAVGDNTWLHYFIGRKF